MITLAELKLLLHYDPETGEFRWRKAPRRGIAAGSLAGTEKEGYVNISIGRELYRAQQLAWLWMTGKPAPGEVRFKNGYGDDLKWDNLFLGRLWKNGRKLTLQGVVCQTGNNV